LFHQMQQPQFHKNIPRKQTQEPSIDFKKANITTTTMKKMP